MPVWCLLSMCSMAPNRPKSSIQLIFGDGIFDGGALLSRDMGIASTCHIVLDQYHLMEEDWPKYFGLAMFEGRLREPLYQYLCSDTEVKLEENYLNIRTILSPNQIWLDYLDNEIHSKRRSICFCYTREYEGECLKPFSIISSTVSKQMLFPCRHPGKGWV